MRADTRQRRIEELLAASFRPDEELVATGEAWHVRVRPGGHRLFAGRHYRLVALTSQRVVVWSRRAQPHRHSTPRFDAPLDTLQLDRTRASLLLQVLTRTSDGTTHVLEFRPGQRAFGRNLARAVTA